MRLIMKIKTLPEPEREIMKIASILKGQNRKTNPDPETV